MRRIRIAICSRNRPSTLVRCIRSVSHALRGAYPEVSADCYVFDDSTTSKRAADMRAALAEESCPNLDLHLIDSAVQSHFIRYVERDNPSAAQFVMSWCKRLGRGPWDAAGVRNFAFIYLYALSDGADLVLFLDDDMVFEDITYHGHFIGVDGAAAIRELSEITRHDYLNVSGASYWGRMDVSVIRHLGYVSELLESAMNSGQTNQLRPLLYDASRFPHELPIRIETLDVPSNIREPLGPGGISGAVLATTPDALRSHGNMRVYNEDWIWQALIGSSRDDIHCIVSRVVHAPPPQVAINKEFAIFQEHGEIVYQAVSRIMNDAPFACDRLEFCQQVASIECFEEAKDYEVSAMRTSLDKMKQVTEALVHLRSVSLEPSLVSSALEGMRRSTEFIEEVHDAVVSESVELAANELFAYLRAIPTWRTNLEAIKLELSPQIIQRLSHLDTVGG